MSRHHKAVSRHQAGRLCRNKKTFVTTGVLKESAVTENIGKSVSIENSLSRQESFIVPIRARLSQHKGCVATQTTQQLSPLSRHQVSHLCRDKGSFVTTEHPRKPVTTGLPRHTAGLPCTSWPLLSRHHCSVMTQNWKCVVAHPIRSHALFFPFCSTYCKTSINLP